MANSTLARRLERLIAAWKRHGAGHVIEVFRQERIRRNYARSPASLPSEAELLNAFGNSGVGNAEQLVHLLLNSAARLFPLDGTDPSERTRFLADLCSATSESTIVRDAELIASGRFPALGLCINEPSGSFAWNRDYGSGKEWPLDPYDRIRYLDGDGADVKYVWELNRMYWIAWLGKAFLLTGNERWATEFMRLMDSWQEQNPVNRGVNWTVAMETGIRSFWLVAGAAMFRNATSIPHSWWMRYFTLIHGHANWTLHNLEYFPNLTNHYIANCFGLVAAGSLFADSATGAKWLTEGVARLETELSRQVTSDGVHYERSIGYHGLVLEMYLLSQHLASQSGKPFSSTALAKIEQMAEFTLHYTPPSGSTLPQLGDSDDGVILRLRSDQQLYDHRHLLAIAGTLFNRPDMIHAAGKQTEQAMLLFGTGYTSRRTEQQALSQLTSGIFREGGFAALRNDRFFVFADAGPIGLHGNNDTLSFTLHTADGTAWIIDPGTGCYTRDEELRNELRSTAAHNAPCIDRTEIAEFAGLWRVSADRTQTRIVESRISDNAASESTKQTLKATHQAYHHLGVTVEREWIVSEERVAVLDRITGEGKHEIAINFTLPENIRVRRISEQSLALISSNQEGHERALLITCSEPLEILESFSSPGYGVILPSTSLRICTERELPALITTEFTSGTPGPI